MNIPEKKYREVEYWSCNDSDHFHKTELVAQNCINRSKKHKPALDLTPRNLLIFHGWIMGLSVKKLSDSSGVSNARIRQIINRFLRILSHPNFIASGHPENPTFKGSLKHHHYKYFKKQYKVLCSYYDITYKNCSPVTVLFDLKKLKTS